MYCKHCGSQISSSDKFCSSCGAMNEDSVQRTNVENRVNSSVNYSNYTNTTSNVERKNKPIIYKNRCATVGLILSILSLITCGITLIPAMICSIIGISDAKKHNDEGLSSSIIGTGICAIDIVILIFVIGVMNTNISDSVSNTETTSYKETITSEETTVEVASNIYEIDEEKYSNDYRYISLKDLDNHVSQIIGEKILIVGSISEVPETGKIQITVPDTVHFDSFYLASDSRTKADELINCRVAIVGIVDAEVDCLFFTSADVKECYVIAVGEEANKYLCSDTDTDISSKFSVVKDEVKDMSEDEYKGNCETVTAKDWEKILRNPDDYQYKLVKLEGKVDQIIEGWFDTYTIYVSDKKGNIWGITYSYKDHESHKLEGDKIVIWGSLQGTETANTILGKQVTFPYISAKYIK